MLDRTAHRTGTSARRARGTPLRVFAQIAVVVALLAGCSIFSGSDPGSVDADSRYEEARDLFRREEWKAAEGAFGRIWRADPDGPLAADARFYEAEARYGRGKYDGAFQLYKQYVENFPLSQHSPRVQQRLFDIGTFTLEGGQGTVLGVFSSTEGGVEYLEYLVSAFPNGDLADDALMRLADYEIGNRGEQSAITHLHDLLDYYPGSEWRLRARLELARAYRRLTRGTSYDGDALNRAAAQYRTYIEIVSADQARAADHASDLTAARSEYVEIQESLARKLLESAEYYLRTGKTDAARAQYRNVIREHPDSPVADEARAALAGIPGGGDAK